MHDSPSANGNSTVVREYQVAIHSVRVVVRSRDGTSEEYETRENATDLSALW